MVWRRSDSGLGKYLAYRLGLPPDDPVLPGILIIAVLFATVLSPNLPVGSSIYPCYTKPAGWRSFSAAVLGSGLLLPPPGDAGRMPYPGDTLRGRFQRIPDERPMFKANLWLEHLDATHNLKRSFSAGHPCGLVQIWSLAVEKPSRWSISSTGQSSTARRNVAFPGRPQQSEPADLQAIRPLNHPEDGSKINKLSNVQYLQLNVLDGVNYVSHFWSI
jgi:hypothetical protein